MTAILMTLDQAAHKVRMTPSLLKWCTRNSVQGSKLVVADDQGSFTATELDRFDGRLKDAWPNKFVPKGISDELKREALGKCLVCGTPGNLEAAHIRRYQYELPHHCQHPNNLALLCRNCHGRYDDPNDQQMTLEVVKHRKAVAQQRLLVAVDQDIQMNHAILAVADEFRTRMHSFEGLGGLVLSVQAVTGSVAPVHGDGLLNLGAMSSSLGDGFPISSATVASLADEPREEPRTWEFIRTGREPWQCLFEDSVALVEAAVCSKCSTEDFRYHNEEPDSVRLVRGVVQAGFSDARGDTDWATCGECGAMLEFEFQTYCSWHAHMAEKQSDE